MQSGSAGKKFATTVVMAGLLAVFGHVDGAELSLPVTGNLLGSVVDAAGIPQMGASVQLLNRYSRVVARTLTNPDGRFAFAGLPLDSYGVRVSVPSFLPAFRDKIIVKSGLDSVLQIHLATLFSNVKLSYSVPSGAMSGDWKWALRASPATRPVTRFLPGELSAEEAPLKPHVFSGTHALLSLSSGDGGLISDSVQSDYGTGFALSTNLLGKNQLQVAGLYGQSAGPNPDALALCAIYSRNPNGGFDTLPEVTLTVSQITRFGTQFAGSNQMPALHTMSLSVYETADPIDGLHLEYGMTGESVDYIQHTSRVSPFARVTAHLGIAGDLIVAYSDGGRPDELTAHGQYRPLDADAPVADDLINAVDALARMPQISNRNNRLELQRTENYELGLNKKAGSRTYAVSTFYEQVSNGRMNLAGNLSQVDSADLLFDGVSKMSTYNIGSYNRMGYLGSVQQRVHQNVEFSLAYGRMGGFTADPLGDMALQQNFLKTGMFNVANANVKAIVPISGTSFTAGYGWTDANGVVPIHVFTSQSAFVSPGLNFAVKQPLPSPFGMPGHLELTADLRNLLAQGYVPIGAVNGQQVLIVPSARTIRGGLNFTF